MHLWAIEDWQFKHTLARKLATLCLNLYNNLSTSSINPFPIRMLQSRCLNQVCFPCQLKNSSSGKNLECSNLVAWEFSDTANLISQKESLTGNEQGTLSKAHRKETSLQSWNRTQTLKSSPSWQASSKGLVPLSLRLVILKNTEKLIDEPTTLGKCFLGPVLKLSDW